ncbi:MAG TPA: alpha/beta fold hydrolase [Acidimicrobiales bacterium]|nr:alpha/beta fold hydrolase [Acidimicrobiales bacterium]
MVGRRLGRRALAVLAVGTTAMTGLHLAGAGAGPTPTARDASYRVGTELQGVASEFSDPTGMPPGVANGPCTPAAAHPFPVVLVHGTFANENFSWQALAPMLADAGYCVFGLNYGATTFTTAFGDHSYGIDYVENSAAELAAFVSRVLAWTTEPDGTHPAAVDMVGHSQGGMMPREYIEHGWLCADGAARCTLDDTAGTPGAARVHLLVGLAPSNHGADAYGLVPLLRAVFGADAYTFPAQAGCGACGEQEAGSPFLDALNGPGGIREAAPGVLYYVVESAYDEVVTPAPNAVDEALGQWPSAFLHGPAAQVDDVRLQDQCPTDATEHIGIIYDPVALWDTMQALGDNGSSVVPLGAPPCPLLVPPLVSG